MKDKHYYETQASETEFLDWYHKYEINKYPKPSATVDNMIYRFDKSTGKLFILIERRGQNPFRGHFALPGGFVNEQEDLINACIRETSEETTLEVNPSMMYQFHTYGTPYRDPRMWLISTVYFTFLSQKLSVTASDDAKSLVWLEIHRSATGDLILQNNDRIIETNRFAFDHFKIINDGLAELAQSFFYNEKLYLVLGHSFNLQNLLDLYQTISGQKISIRHLANTLKTSGIVQAGPDGMFNLNKKTRLY